MVVTIPAKALANITTGRESTPIFTIWSSSVERNVPDLPEGVNAFRTKDAYEPTFSIKRIVRKNTGVFLCTITDNYPDNL